MSTPTTAVLVVASIAALALVAFGLAPVVTDLGPVTGFMGAVWLFAIGASAILAVTVAAVAFLPPLLLRGADRAATVVHSWIGARETRRAFGRASRAATALGSPESVARWLAETPATDAWRPVRFEALVYAGRFDAARAEAELMPERTPFEAYRRLEALALVDEQTGAPFDEPTLREAIARIPSGPDRVEATASLAVALARQAIPLGGWRLPLVQVRPLLREPDRVILTRDLGLPIFEVMARHVLLPLVLLMGAIAVILSVASFVL